MAWALHAKKPGLEDHCHAEMEAEPAGILILLVGAKWVEPFEDEDEDGERDEEGAEPEVDCQAQN